MKTADKSPRDIDEYIAGFPEDVQVILQKIRATIRETAPEARETIKYQMPTFTLGENLVHFSAYKKHIGFYPAPTNEEEFSQEVAKYGSGKGTLKFPFDEPVPYDLIARIVKFRVRLSLKQAKEKK